MLYIIGFTPLTMFIEILVLLLALPSGFLLAYLANDELIQGRKWFKVLIILFVILGSWFYLADFKAITYTSGFIIIVSFISLIKSYDKKWTRRRI